jgi:hypothetical protein
VEKVKGFGGTCRGKPTMRLASMELEPEWEVSIASMLVLQLAYCVRLS